MGNYELFNTIFKKKMFWTRIWYFSPTQGFLISCVCLKYTKIKLFFNENNVGLQHRRLLQYHSSSCYFEYLFFQHPHHNQGIIINGC